MITECAPAKVNLTLEVHGRRADGYHELASLVAFADIGDLITLDPGKPLGLTVAGPFASALVGDNLIHKALRRLAEVAPELELGCIHLEKRLPVAAGIGGGSADAAAVLRAVRRANEARGPRVPGRDTRLTRLDAVPWAAIAASLGADVPVCFASRTCWITGTGTELARLEKLPPLHAVLVNDLGVVQRDKTARVFRALNASLVPGHHRDTVPRQLNHCEADQLIAFMSARGNGLAKATEEVLPGVTAVLAALRGEDVAAGTVTAAPHIPPAIAAMSGAGPTCFGIYASQAEAQAAAANLSQRHPRWWVKPTLIG
jgi:4-diphosphocytidyl-2-C-methyl-D-erythritol kinase